jgi:hypothetical protein
VKSATVTAALALLLGAAGVAAGDDYPFTGYFSIDEPSDEIAERRLLCATGFIRQDADGSFVNYHLDMPAYEADGAIAYLKYTAGTCVIDPDNVETCTVTFDTIPEEVDLESFDVLGAITSRWVEYAMFDSPDNARSWLESGEPEPIHKGRFTRCPGYDDTRLRPFLSDRESALSLDDRTALISATEEAASVATRTEIVERILGQQ